MVASPEDPVFLSPYFGQNVDPGQCLAAQYGILEALPSNLASWECAQLAFLASHSALYGV